VICCVTLDPAIEELVTRNVQSLENRSVLNLAPQLQTKIGEAIRAKVNEVTPRCGDTPPVVLCAPQARMWIRRMTRTLLANVAVLSYNEIVRDVHVESKGMVILDRED